MIMSVTLDALKQLVVNMNDAEIIERQTGQGHPVTLLFIRTLIDQERLNEAVIGPLNGRSHDTIIGSLAAPRDAKITALNEARKHLLQGPCSSMTESGTSGGPCRYPIRWPVPSKPPKRKPLYSDLKTASANNWNKILL